jgi:hypothetical protein
MSMIDCLITSRKAQFTGFFLVIYILHSLFIMECVWDQHQGKRGTRSSFGRRN